MKQYDRTELLDKAIELFRRQGYTDTSTAELVDELGVNRKTMYAEFGSKQQLFDAALERYSQEHLSKVLRPLEAADADHTAIREAFDSYARASSGWVRGRGCLLCNTAVERAALDDVAARHVTAYLGRLTSAFHNALANEPDESTNEGELADLASFFTMSLIGVVALIRAQAPVDQIHAAAKVATSVLNP